jgi:hypothetical protein
MAQEPEFLIPAAISYQTLKQLLPSAPRGEAEAESELPALQGALGNYAAASKLLLQELIAQKGSTSNHFSQNQLMALGALSAHVQMALQALKASQN